MSLQQVKFPEIDIPQMHYVPAGGLTASLWAVVHLGDVDFGFFDPLWRRPRTSRGALTIPDAL